MWSRKKGNSENAVHLEQAQRLSSLLLTVLSQVASEVELSEEARLIIADALRASRNLTEYLNQAAVGQRSNEWYVGEAISLRGQLARLTTRMSVEKPRFLEDPNIEINAESHDLALIKRDLRNVGIEDTQHARYFIRIAQQILEEIDSITKFSLPAYGKSYVVRKIKPKQEHKQVVLAILNYFGRVIEQKHAGINLKVSTEQTPDEVTFLIEMDSRDKDTVDEELYNYGMVVMEQMSAEAYLPVTSQALELKHKLEISKMELRHTTELLRAEREGYGKKIGHLEGEVSWLRKTIGEGITQNHELQMMIAKFAGDSSRTIQDSLVVVLRKALDGLEHGDEERVSDELKKIRSEDPSVLERLRNISSEIFTGTTANLLVSWITSIIGAYGSKG